MIRIKIVLNLAKLGDGLEESRTDMVGDNKTNKTKICKNTGKLKPSWAFVETNNYKTIAKLSQCLNCQNG